MNAWPATTAKHYLQEPAAPQLELEERKRLVQRGRSVFQAGDRSGEGEQTLYQRERPPSGHVTSTFKQLPTLGTWPAGDSNCCAW